MFGWIAKIVKGRAADAPRPAPEASSVAIPMTPEMAAAAKEDREKTLALMGTAIRSADVFKADAVEAIIGKLRREAERNERVNFASLVDGPTILTAEQKRQWLKFPDEIRGGVHITPQGGGASEV